LGNHFAPGEERLSRFYPTRIFQLLEICALFSSKSMNFFFFAIHFSAKWVYNQHNP